MLTIAFSDSGSFRFSRDFLNKWLCVARIFFFEICCKNGQFGQKITVELSYIQNLTVFSAPAVGTWFTPQACSPHCYISCLVILVSWSGVPVFSLVSSKHSMASCENGSQIQGLCSGYFICLFVFNFVSFEIFRSLLTFLINTNTSGIIPLPLYTQLYVPSLTFIKKKLQIKTAQNKCTFMHTHACMRAHMCTYIHLKI